MVCCSAWGCANRSEKGVRMYGFPAETERREKWLAQISRRDLKIKQNYNYKKLCEAHFEADQFVRTRKGKTRLRSDAIPTIFVHRPAVKRRKPPTPRFTARPPNIKYIAADHSYSVANDRASRTKERKDASTQPTSLLLQPPAHSQQCSSTHQHPTSITPVPPPNTAPPPSSINQHRSSTCQRAPSLLLFRLPLPIITAPPPSSTHHQYCSTTYQHPTNTNPPSTCSQHDRSSTYQHYPLPLLFHLPEPNIAAPSSTSIQPSSLLL